MHLLFYRQLIAGVIWKYIRFGICPSLQIFGSDLVGTSTILGLLFILFSCISNAYKKYCKLRKNYCHFQHHFGGLSRSSFSFSAVIFLDPVSEKLNRQVMNGNLKTSHIFYKYLEKALDFVEHAQNKQLGQFSWNGDDSTLVNFLASILHHGHASTYNLLRGPGFLSQGRGEMEFLWPDWNFPLPPPEKLRRFEGGYTTQNGVISAFALSFLKVCQSPTVTPVVDTDAVKVYPVIEADDGMALKPGMQIDSRQAKAIGIKDIVDINYVKVHMTDEPTQFKEKFVKEAHVTCATTLDSKVSMPVAVDYITGGLSGEDMLNLRRKRTEQLQMCQSCVEKCIPKGAVLPYPITCELNVCQACVDMKLLCDACEEAGHTHWNPCLRPCRQCSSARKQCIRLVSIGKSSDCEEKNKKALLSAHKDLKNGSAPVYAQQQVPIPDAVHLGKNLNGAFSNWFLLYDGGRINKSILRTLCKDNKIGSKLKEVVTSKALRNRDRMDTTVVTEVSSPEVCCALKKVKRVVHTLIPEMFRLYESNKPGVLKHPIQTCMGPESSILVIDHTKGMMCKGRLHYPMDVTVQMKGLKKPEGVWYSSGVAFVANTGNNEILYQDLGNVTRLKVSALKKKELHDECLKRGLTDSTENNVKTLRDLLKQHFDSQHDGELTQKLHLDTPIFAPGAMTGNPVFFSSLYVASKATKVVYKINVESDGTHLCGKVVHQWEVGEASGLHLQGEMLYIAVQGTVGGVFAVNINADVPPIQLLKNGTEACSNAADVTTSRNKLYFTDVGSRKVKEYCLTSKESAFTVGTDENTSRDGSENTAAFLQPIGLCSEEDTLYVCDTAVGCVKMISPVTSLVSYLEAMYKMYDSFGIHTETKPQYFEIVENLEKVIAFLKKGEDDARKRHSKEGAVQGPDGVVASKTVESIQLLLQGIKDVYREVLDISSAYQDKINFKSLLTLVCERLFSSMRARYEMPLMLQFAHLLGHVVTETLKSITDCGFNLFTARSSYYPIPDGCIPFGHIPHIPIPPSVTCSKDDLQALYSFQQLYGQSVRQQSVRSLTTKDKPGTLPISAYEQLKPKADYLNFDSIIETQTNDNSATCTTGEMQHDTVCEKEYRLLPKGTISVAMINNEALLVKFLEDLKEDNDSIAVQEFVPNHLDCLQFVSRGKSCIAKNSINVILDPNQCKCTSDTIEIDDGLYHGLLSNANYDEDREVEEEHPADSDFEMRTRRGRSIRRPTRFLDM